MRSPTVVLVADDNPVNLTLAVEFLRILGYQSVTANDGVEALAVLQTLEPAAVLMDLNMPRLDGLDATRQLREMEARTGRRRVPVISWTASAPYATEAECKAAGMDTFLPKPLDLPSLRSVLAEVAPLC